MRKRKKTGRVVIPEDTIIDLSRIKQKEEKAIREIKHQLELLRGVGRIIVITKSREVLVLSGKLI